MKIMLEVSTGDFLDRVSILEIKAERFTDEGRRANVEAHLAALAAMHRAALGSSPDLPGAYDDLKAVNETLWDIENQIRACEAAGDFGPTFVELARSVYISNDRRAAIKRSIDDIVGSAFTEEKEYHGDRERDAEPRAEA